jgi:hypothetical protein
MMVRRNKNNGVRYNGTQQDCMRFGRIQPERRLAMRQLNTEHGSQSERSERSVFCLLSSVL